MKTMTCRQLGGPCDTALRGNTADEVIPAGEKHFREMVASGDESHQDALQKMEDRWKNPAAGMDWYKQTQSDFAALSDDQYLYLEIG